MIAEYEFYFFLPSRKFKICWVIFKEGEKIGILPASQWSCPKAHAALPMALARLGGTRVGWNFTREISRWRGGGWVSTHSSSRKGRGLAATLLRIAILAFSGVDFWCLFPRGFVTTCLLFSHGPQPWTEGRPSGSVPAWSFVGPWTQCHESQTWVSRSWVDEEFGRTNPRNSIT